MFFGLEVKSNSKPIILENTTKLSQAVLEPSKNGKREPVSLVAEYNKKQFILCVLDPSLSWQCPLDLLFEGGAEVKFSLRGSGTVHLTGYEPLDDYDDMNYSISSVSSSEEDEMEVTPSKAKKALTNGTGSASKSAKKSVRSARKSKSNDLVVQDNADDSDDSEDADFMYNSSGDDFELVKQGLGSSSDDVTASDDSDLDDEDDSDEDEDDDDDDDDDDEDDDDEEDGCQIEEMVEDSD